MTKQERAKANRVATMLRVRAMRDPNDLVGAKARKAAGKIRKLKGPIITRSKLRRAIRKSYGIQTEIAKKLGVTRQAVMMRFKQWPDLAKLLEREKERFVDTAKSTLRHCVQQREHIPTAFGAAKWIMERQGGMIQVKKIQLEGGDSPIRIEQTQTLPGEILGLPLGLRKQILTHLNKTNNGTKRTLRVRRILP